MLTGRQPSDDLLYAKEAVLENGSFAVCEDSLLMWMVRRKLPRGNEEEWMMEVRRIVATSPFLDSLLSSFSFYVECCLDYMTEQVREQFPEEMNELFPSSRSL